MTQMLPQQALLIHAIACILALGACEATSPEVAPIGSTDQQPGAPYADLVLSYTEAGVPVSCTESIPALCTVQEGSCANHAALGAPDGQDFQLQAGGQIELGFLCHPIVDQAPESELSSDFRIIGSLNLGGSAIVSVSTDGSDYTVLDTFSQDDQAFDLATEGFDYVRFIRIATPSGVSMSIDAVEVLN